VWPWLATIAARACLDIQRRRTPVPVGSAVQQVDVAARELDPAESQIDRVRAELVSDALAAVPDKYRVALYLREAEGWSNADIAALQGTTVGAVRTALVRGRRLLRARLTEIADSRGLWPLPAALPIGGVRTWRERVARVLHQPPIVTMTDLAGALLAGLPSLTNAAVAALALIVGFGGSAAGAVDASQIDPHPVHVADVRDARPPPVSGDPARNGGTATTGGGPEARVEVVIEPASSSIEARGTADLSDPEKRSLEHEVNAALPGDNEVEAPGDVTIYCEGSFTGQTVCTALDQLPHSGEPAE